LTIAHRLTTIQNSKQISAVDQGFVKESRTYQQQGIYYKLNQVQQRNQNSHQTFFSLYFLFRVFS